MGKAIPPKFRNLKNWDVPTMDEDYKPEIIDWLRECMDGGNIIRYHAHPLTKSQDVSAHSHRVSLVVLAVWPECRQELLKAAVYHDLSELATGDVPSTTKWAHPTLGTELNRVTTEWEKNRGLRVSLTRPEMIVLKLADMIEGAMFCMDRYRNGEQKGGLIANAYIQASVEYLNENTFGAENSTVLNTVQNNLMDLLSDLEADYIATHKRLNP